VDVTRTKNVALIRKLVKVKGMPNNHCHSKDGANALVECCKNGSIEGFKAILTAGANIDSPNKKGPTTSPEYIATRTGFACSGHGFRLHVTTVLQYLMLR
jgi:hypothetical protein